MLKRLLFIPVTLVLSFGCSNDTNTIADSEVVQMYTEILLIRSQQADTALANPRVDSLLRAHGYTMNTYEQELTNLYQKQGPQMLEFLDSVKSQIEQMRVESAAVDSTSNP